MQPQLQNNNQKELLVQRSYSEGKLEMMNINNDLISKDGKYIRKSSVPPVSINTSFNDQDSAITGNNNSSVIRSYSNPTSSENNSVKDSIFLNNSTQSQNQPSSPKQSSNLYMSSNKYSPWISTNNDKESNIHPDTKRKSFIGQQQLQSQLPSQQYNDSTGIMNHKDTIPPPTRNISLNHSLPIIQNGNATNGINNNYLNSNEDNNYYNNNNYLYKPQIHLEKQQIGQLEQIQSQIQPEYKEQIQQLQQQQEQLVINSTHDHLLTPPRSKSYVTPSNYSKPSNATVSRAKSETKLLNDYADVMDIVSLIPTIIGENIDIPPDQSPIRQHFVSQSPTSKSVPITPLSEQINVTSKRHNDYIIKKKEVNSLKRRSSLKYESYHGFDDSDNSPAIVYSNPDTSCSFKRSGSSNSNSSTRLSNNNTPESILSKNITKTNSPLSLNAPMIPPMMMDSTTAAMLETHGSSLLLQQDLSMSSGPSSNHMNMSFTEGITNKRNMNELNRTGISELSNGKIINPLSRKTNRHFVIIPNSTEAIEDKNSSERRHRSHKHSHSHHRKDVYPDNVEGEFEGDRELRERRHSRLYDDTESERRERRQSRQFEDTESERRERHRRTRRPVKVIDENGVEKIMYKRHHHHRSNRHEDFIEDNINNSERSEKPRSSHRNSRQKQSLIVGEQQQRTSSRHHSHVHSKHQSLTSVPSKASPYLDYSTGNTSINVDPRMLNEYSYSNPSNIPNNNSNANPTNLPTQEINDFFDNIFKLNWTL